MNYRYTATIATVFNSLQDAILDYAVNKFNYYKVLLYTSTFAFVFQLLYGLNTEITVTYASIPYLLLHAVFILSGYVCFIKALKYLPLGLAGLVESSGLFITLFIDAYLGYIQITLYLLSMLALLIFSIILFKKDCDTDEKTCIKHIKPQGFIYISITVFLYTTAPYLVKICDHLGANTISINLSYYLLALPYFAYQYLSCEKKSPSQVKKWYNNFFFLCIVVGILESAYWILETISFINEAPTIVVIIDQMRIFLMFILSVIFQMDRFTIKKLIALILGTASIIGVYYY